MLRWPSAIIGVFCAVAAYGQQGTNQNPSLQNPASTSAINITPLRVEMDSAEFSEQIQIRNESDEPLNLQLRIFGWLQIDGTDRYSLSSDINISPSITRISARQTQNFRMARAADKKNMGEMRYRIIIDQLPNLSAATTSQSKTRLRFSVPLFVGRDTATEQELEWKISGRQLNIVNKGGKTAKIDSLMLVKRDGAQIEIKGDGTRYVLGGSDVLWNIDADTRCDGGPLRITALVDQKIVNAIPSTNCP